MTLPTRPIAERSVYVLRAKWLRLLPVVVVLAILLGSATSQAGGALVVQRYKSSYELTSDTDISVSHSLEIGNTGEIQVPELALQYGSGVWSQAQDILVTRDKKPIDATRTDNGLVVALEPSFAPGETTTLTIEYVLKGIVSLEGQRLTAVMGAFTPPGPISSDGDRVEFGVKYRDDLKTIDTFPMNYTSVESVQGARITHYRTSVMPQTIRFVWMPESAQTGLTTGAITNIAIIAVFILLVAIVLYGLSKGRKKPQA